MTARSAHVRDVGRLICVAVYGMQTLDDQEIDSLSVVAVGGIAAEGQAFEEVRCSSSCIHTRTHTCLYEHTFSLVRNCKYVPSVYLCACQAFAGFPVAVIQKLRVC